MSVKKIIPPEERFISKIHFIPFHECWEWGAGKSHFGHGKFRVNNKRETGAHRAALFIFCGIDAGDLCVCHKCDNPGCVRPEHLFLGTRRDNALDMYRKGRNKSIPPKYYPREPKKICVNGHKYTKENTISNKGGRRCKECKNSQERLRYKNRLIKTCPECGPIAFGGTLG